jgi:hypothetical protein
MSDMKEKPRVNSKGAQELDKAQEQLDQFTAQVKEAVASSQPVPEGEPQVKMSNREIHKSNARYLKPSRSIASKEPFNEKFRAEYNFKKEYVQFIAEHSELIGSSIEKWTKPFAGMPAEYWEVPTNVPVWGPRYLAEEIKEKCSYNRLSMDQGVHTGSSAEGKFFGQLVVSNTIQRLDARPVSSRKSIFMGADGN